jgi:uncharacterized membrane protein
VSILLLVVAATFLAAAVEWVEALTIVLAVGTTRGWRSALIGLAAGLIALLALVAVLGVTVTSRVPVTAARTLVGVFLLLFGLRWLHKAILRSSGLTSLHDEAKIFDRTRAELALGSHGARRRLDWVGASTSFNGVFLEGLEVVFIVVALGGVNALPAAVIGALASLVGVAVAGVALRHPLTRVPENTMKYVVGIMLTSFGTFFVGEGIGVHWWMNDLSLIPLIAAYLVVSLVFVQILRNAPIALWPEIRVLRAIRAAVGEVWGLFVDDGPLAVVAIVVVLACSVFIDHVSGQKAVAGVLLVVGITLAVAISLADVVRQRRAASPKLIEPEGSVESEPEASVVPTPS